MTGDLPPVSREARWLVAGACAISAVMYALYVNGIGPDDPWITYRYSENLAAGRGFVYNVGERVQGTSTPLYALLLALVSFVGLPVPPTSLVICFASMIASVILMFLLVRRLHGEPAGVAAALLLATAYFFHRIATFGLETPFYTMLIIASFLAYAQGRELLAAALAGLCLVTRLDGAAVGAALFAAHIVTKRTFPWRAALVFLAVVAPWFAFAKLYYGHFVPNTMTAKRMHTDYTRLWWMPKFLAFEPRAWFAALGAAIALLSPVLRARCLPFAIWGAMYAGAYSLAAIQRYDWYLGPIMPVLSGFAAIAVVELARRFGRSTRTQLATGIAMLCVLSMLDGGRGLKRLMGNEGILGLERVRKEAALWMRDSLPGDAPIAMGGIGLVGYYTGRRVYDAMGLVTPSVMRLSGPVTDPRLMSVPRFLQAVIDDFNPEYVFDGFWFPEGADYPPFMEGRYTIMKEWRGDDPRWPRFILYRRNAPSSM